MGLLPVGGVLVMVLPGIADTVALGDVIPGVVVVV